jgi:uncharacterized spore protein YtfJ
MDLNFEELSDKLLDKLSTVAKTKTIIGEQFELGDFLCVPIIKVSMGFGSGGGTGDSPKQGKGIGGGAGGGVKVEPIGFLVAKGDEISLMDVGKSKGIAAIFDKVPDMMEKMMQMKCKKEDKEE